MRFLGHERTMPRKLREALVATWLDAHLGKDEILTLYLNSVYLGNGAYGMAAAARLYFDKRPSDLRLPEAAMLAGLTCLPGIPQRNLRACSTTACTRSCWHLPTMSWSIPPTGLARSAEKICGRSGHRRSARSA